MDTERIPEGDPSADHGRDVWIPGRTIPDHECFDVSTLFETRSDGAFHIGTYTVPAASVVCRGCGGNTFKVGVGSYWTGIKCVTCGWEVCIHDG